MSHGRNLSRSIAAIALLTCACQFPARGSGPLEGQGNTFRDLRQHTAANTDDVTSSMSSLSPDGSRMAFVLLQESGNSSNEDIYVKTPNSKARVQKTTHRASDSFPAISPDGTKIAFASRRNGSYDIFITNLDSGRAKRQITFSEEEEIAPSWSPDGETIAYCKLSRSSREWEIWLYNLSNGAVTYLVPGLFPSYSPSETLLAFQRADNPSGRYGIWTIDEAGTEETQVLSSTEEGYYTPKWSPDGKKLVFASSGKNVGKKWSWGQQTSERVVDDLAKVRAADIWTMNVDGTDLSQLTTHDDDDWYPCWSGDGRIYFSSLRDGYMNLWSVVPEFVEIGGTP